jgi:aspartate 1-decarboxylase
MRRSVLKSTVRPATVTDADLDYEGSVTIDEELMRAADILPHEQVQIWNLTNGSRLSTYALVGAAGSGVICVNGAAARHAHRGDKVVIATFAEVEQVEAKDWQPVVVRVDAQNKIRGGATGRDPEVNIVDPATVPPAKAPAVTGPNCSNRT